ncbi:hypothetical protein Tco_0195851 [Tanacetum coccineum]
MANQEQNPPKQEQPFIAAKQIGFNLKDIILNTNNEVSLLYPEHNIKDHFRCVSDFISKCCLRKPFTRSPNMYKEYLAEFWYSAKTLENSKVFFSIPTGGIYGKVGVNTFRNVIGAHYLPHSSEYVAPPFIDIMKEGYGDGELTLYPTQVFSVNNWALKPNQPEEPPFTTHMLAICSAYKPVAFKAPKPSSNVERVPQGTKPGAKPGHKKHSTSLKQPSVSNKEETKGGYSKAPIGFKIGHSKKRKESSSAMDSNPSQPPVSTPVDTGMHKEDQQATSGPTFLGVTRNDASAASITEANPGNFAPRDFVPQQQGMNKGTKNTSYDYLFAETSTIIKLEDLAKLVSHVQPSFKDLDSPEEDHVIVLDDSDEDEDDEVHATKNSQKHKLELEKNKAEAKVDLLKAQPSFPNVEQLKELLVKSLKTKFSNIISAHDFSSSLPTELKDLPSKLNKLTGEVKGLKKKVHELEIELPGDLKEIPTKLDDFTKNVTSLTSQVAELKTLQWELPAEFLSLPAQVASVQAKLKTLDALPSLLLTVTQALNKFAQVLNFASSKAGDQSVLLVGQADTMPAEGEKNTNQATIS